jgi:hypothetical protein
VSALLGIVQSTVQAVVSVSPSPSPSPVAVAAVTTHAGTLSDTVNAFASRVSQADLIAFAAAVSFAITGALSKVPFFTHAVAYVQDLRRFTLSAVVPTVLVAGSSLASGHNTLGLTPLVFLGSQIAFYVFKTLYGAALSALNPQPGVEAAPQL